MSGAGSRPHRGNIVSIANLTPEIIHCRVRCDQSVVYQPGQYCMVDVENTARAFSFVTLPGTREVEFLINTRHGGPASRWFRSAKVGDDTSFGHPSGDFLLDPVDTRPLLYIAGGVGLAPIMAHLKELAATHFTRPVTLIVGHRSPENVFWHENLKKFAAETGITYHMYIGPFLDQLAEVPNLSEHAVYICGSAGMCTTVADALYTQGLSPAQVHYELFT